MEKRGSKVEAERSRGAETVPASLRTPGPGWTEPGNIPAALCRARDRPAAGPTLGGVSAGAGDQRRGSRGSWGAGGTACGSPPEPGSLGAGEPTTVSARGAWHAASGPNGRGGIRGAEGARRGGGAGWPRAGGRSRAAPSLQGSDATYRQAIAPISVARPFPSAPAAASPMRGPRMPAAGTQPPFWLPEHAVWERPRRRPASDFRGLRPVGHGRPQGRGTAPCPALPENRGASRPHSDTDVLVPGDLQPVSSLSVAMCFLAISALRPGFSLSSPVALLLGGKASRLSSA